MTAPEPIPTSEPAPTPTPAPVPAPTPDAADIALVATAGPWANDEHLTHRNRAVATAIRAWRAAKGL
jgi:hypothetical protein